MLCTEKEAKGKACCKMFPYLTDENGRPAACIASDCMAWRWVISKFCLDEDRYLVAHENTDSEIELRCTGNGFCGLAGEPGGAE